MWTFYGLLIFSFLSGSIPFGWIFAHRHGVNLRKVGSGNIGATNVSRAMGLRWGLIVFGLDTLKGVIPVLMARFYMHHEPQRWGWIALAAVAGHMFSPWLKFRGGKGVATAFGAFIALEPWAATMAFGIFLVMLGMFSYVALASMTAALAFVLFLYLLFQPPPLLLSAAVLTALLILIRHESNLRRLLRGEEDRIRWSKAG